MDNHWLLHRHSVSTHMLRKLMWMLQHLGVCFWGMSGLYSISSTFFLKLCLDNKWFFNSFQSVSGNLPLKESQAGTFPLTSGRHPKYTQRCVHIMYTMHKIIRSGRKLLYCFTHKSLWFHFNCALTTASRHSTRASLWQQTQSRHESKQRFVPFWAFYQISLDRFSY